jgi:hypothetical protein
MINPSSPGPGPPASSPTEFGLCSRKRDNFGHSRAHIREGKRAALRHLAEDNRELRRHISEIGQQIAATETENRILEQSLRFFQQQLANFGFWLTPSDDPEDISPPQTG